LKEGKEQKYFQTAVQNHDSMCCNYQVTVEFCVFRLASLAEIFFHRGKREYVKTNAYRPSYQFRNLIALCTPKLHAEHFCLWMLVLTTHPI